MRKFFVVALGITTLGALAAAERASATVKCHNQCVRTYTDSNGVTTCQHYLQRCENVNVPPDAGPARRPSRTECREKEEFGPKVISARSSESLNPFLPGSAP